jgi:hypothetical protein
MENCLDRQQNRPNDCAVVVAVVVIAVVVVEVVLLHLVLLGPPMLFF